MRDRQRRRFGRRYVPLCAALSFVVVVGLSALDVATVHGDARPLPRREEREVPVDMATGWLRRDWQGCSDPTRITVDGGAIAFESRSSSAMMWQVPTLEGPLAIDPSLGWVRSCDRAPLSWFKRLAAHRGTDGLIDLSEYPYLRWRWRVDGGVDDSRLAHPDGRIRHGYDDFAAKLGVVVQVRDSDEVHEVAYVWARSTKVGTLLRQETTIIPFVRKMRAARVVVETGRGYRRWVDELHDVRADFARLLPGKQAGRALRIYLMTDSDDTRGTVSTAYSDIRFLRSPGPSEQRIDEREPPAASDLGSAR
jgi:hypothetical protein